MDLELFLESMRKSMMEIHRDTEALCANKTVNAHDALEHLKREVMILDGKLQKLDKSNQIRAAEMPVLQPENNPQGINEVTTRAITLEELATNDGKNGNPAYVAVNGLVYDVTNSAVWAAGTHFGLSAGRDLTEKFATCHKEESILDKLTIVGFLS